MVISLLLGGILPSNALEPIEYRGIGSPGHVFGWADETLAENEFGRAFSFEVMPLTRPVPLDSIPPLPILPGTRIGVHSFERKGYFVVEVDCLQVVHNRDADYDGLVAGATQVGSEASNYTLPDDFVYRSLFIWLPDSASLTPTNSPYAPDHFSGFKPLARKEVKPLDESTLKEEVTKILLANHLEPLPFLFELETVSVLPGDDAGNYDFYGLKVPFVSDTSWGVHFLVLRYDKKYIYQGMNRITEPFTLIEIATARDKLQNRDRSFIEDDNRYFELDECYLSGVLDVDFDGLYEVMITTYWGDYINSHGNYTTVVYTFRNGKKEWIDPANSHGGC